MFRTLLISVAAVSLAATSSAQQKQHASTERATTAQYAGTYSPNTGLVAPHNGGVAKSGPDCLWNNNTLTNYYSVPGAGFEWIDEGTLPDRNTGSLDQINGIEFTYCSTVADATQNSISSTMRFYSETAYCAGPAAWPAADCAYGIAGLPGGDPNGVIQCWVVSLDLMGGFECELATNPSTGLFGWSNAYDQNDTGPWLASGGVGNTDTFVSFDPAAGNGNEFQGCFFFGGPPSNPFAGFATKMFGAPTDVMTDLDCPPNTMVLAALNAAVAGSPMDFEVTGAPAPGGTRMIVCSAARATPLDLGFGSLCCDHTTIVFDSTSADGFHSTPPIPGSVVGSTFCVQAANDPTPLSALSNALFVTVN